MVRSGEYATFSSDDKTFEAHLNLDQVASVTMAASKVDTRTDTHHHHQNRSAAMRRGGGDGVAPS